MKYRISDVEYEIIISALIFYGKLRSSPQQWPLYDICYRVRYRHVDIIDIDTILAALAISKILYDEQPEIFRHLERVYECNVIKRNLNSVMNKIHAFRDDREL